MVISNGYRSFLIHSAKGSTWEDHKYIKRIDGTYYYPDSYEGGRHLPGGDKNDDSDNDSDNSTKNAVKRFWEERERATKNGEAYESDNPDDPDWEWYGEMDPERFREYYESYMEPLGDKSLSDEELSKIQKELAKQQEEKYSQSENLSDKDIDNLAKEVIKGNFGNGQIRKDLLGENYQEVQDKVNELLKGKTGSKKISEVSNEVKEEGEKAVKKATSTKTSKTPNLDRVFNVYRKKK